MYDEVKNVEKVHDDLGQTNSRVCSNNDGSDFRVHTRNQPKNEFLNLKGKLNKALLVLHFLPNFWCIFDDFSNLLQFEKSSNIRKLSKMKTHFSMMALPKPKLNLRFRVLSSDPSLTK